MKDFYIGVFEVTQGQWEKVMKANPANFKIGKGAPVEQVSWEDCQDFMKELNGKKSSALAFRLPTEAEWEYACRAGTEGDIYGENLDELRWYDKNAEKTTHEVGKKKDNELGIYDMSGNAWEWCSDWFGDYSKEPGKDPLGAKSGSSHVTRGGGWSAAIGYARSSSRHSDSSKRYPDIGFRPILPAQ